MNLRKSLTLAAVVLIMAATLAVKHNAVAEEKNVAAQELKADLPTLIDLSAEWCSACQAQKKILADFVPKYGHKFNMVYSDPTEDKEMAQKYNVKVIPTLVFLKPDGEIFLREEGVMEEQDLLAAFEKGGFPLVEKK